MTTKKRIAEVAARLKESSRILILSHYSPDGDAIGSTLGLGIPLIESGYNVTIANVDGVPDHLKWLPGSDKVVTAIPSDVKWDAVLLMDCAEPERTGFKELAGIPEEAFITIDHHPGNSGYGNLIIIDTDAAATGELSYKILQEMGVKITKDGATSLYTAIETDTGRFRFSNVTPETMEISADLIRHGANPAHISSWLNNREKPERVLLLGKVLSTLKIYDAGRVGVIDVSRKMLGETGATLDDVDGFVNYPLSIAGVEVAVFLKEKEDNLYRIGLRASGDVNVSEIAQRYGGGGHLKASGLTLEGTLKETTTLLLGEISRALLETEAGS